jgi:two-component system OmpR family response regulator
MSRGMAGKMFWVDDPGLETRTATGIDVLVVGPCTTDTSGLMDALSAGGLRVERAHDPDALAHTFVAGRPRAVVIDLRDNDELGNRMVSWVCRNQGCNVLVITALTQTNARLTALDLGAADHLVAPFELREGIGRVQRLMARAQSTRDDRETVGDLTIDASQRSVERNGQTTSLTPRELEVLQLLVDHRNRPVSKQEILSSVWKGESRSENVVEANVSSLRRKLHASGAPVIHTVHRSGYVFRPVAEAASITRGALVAERDRLVRERDEKIARRDELIRRLRAERVEERSRS